jgi:antitoxin MazE
MNARPTKTTTRLTKIGNSRGVRIPKALIEQAGLEGEVELIARDGEIIISNTRNPREGWEQSFVIMAKRGDDNLVMPDIFPEESFDEWK